MALSITVNGGGTFSASMEEGPVSFTASLGAVPGPKGDTGAAGANGSPGVVAATAPIVYTSGTQTVSMDTAYFVRSPAVAGTDTQILSWDAGTTRPLWIDNQTRALFMLGTNKTGTTIAKGKAVYVSGATGNHPEITLAQANAELSSASTIGITAEEIANNGTGKVIVSGRLENVNTNGFTAGDTLYLSPSSAGGFTTTFPTQPNHGVLLGYVTRANTNNGVIEVVVKNYQELGEQSDVLLTSKTNNDLLAYESSSGLWKNKSFATLGLATSSDLSAYLLSSTAASTYLAKASNLSDLASASTARTNLGLGTMATETAANYALLASPALTGTPTAPTAATTTNTTQIATTAFVQQEVPNASTTARGKIEIATDSEARTGTDTSRAITAAQLREGLVCGGYIYGNRAGFALATSGTGAVATSESVNGLTVSAPTSAAGHGRAAAAISNPRRGGHNQGRIKFNEPSIFAARINRASTSTDSGSVFRMSVGKIGTIANGDLTSSDQAAQIKIAGGGAMTLLVANGTTLTTTTLSNTPSDNVAYDVEIVMDGTGNAEVFVDGSSVGTSTGAPTSNTTASAARTYLQIEAVNDSTITATRASYVVSNIFFYTPA
jgi:hypothetical protein